MYKREILKRRMSRITIIPVLFFCVWLSRGNLIGAEIKLAADLTHPVLMVNSEKKSILVEMVLINGNKIADFRISRYEVTQELYESVMGTNPSYFKGSTLPVEQVSWFNAVEFCNRLSIKAGFNSCYNIDKKNDGYNDGNYGSTLTVTLNKDADGYRLPESAEWEIAARAGSQGKYFRGEEDMRLDKTDFRSPQLEFGFIGIRLVRNK